MQLAASILALATLLASLVLPVAAHGQAVVTRTFRLTLYGDVPANESFRLVYATASSYERQEIHFCGDADSRACRGGGMVYEHRATFPRGVSVRYSFRRIDAATGEPLHEFAYNEEVLSSAAAETASIAAYYDLRARTGGPGDAPPEDPPPSAATPTALALPPEVSTTITFRLVVYGEPSAGDLVLQL